MESGVFNVTVACSFNHCRAYISFLASVTVDHGISSGGIFGKSVLAPIRSVRPVHCALFSRTSRILVQGRAGSSAWDRVWIRLDWAGVGLGWGRDCKRYGLAWVSERG